MKNEAAERSNLYKVEGFVAEDVNLPDDSTGEV